MKPAELLITPDVFFLVQSAQQALSSILTPEGILLLFVGTAIGLLFGAMPGVGSTVAIALMIPVTFELSPQLAIMTLTAILGGSAFGGSISAILLNIPGSAPNAATLIDGHPLAKQGKANTAIGASAVASAGGAVIGVLFLLAFIPLLRSLLRLFGPPEFFAMSLFGLTVIAVVVRGAAINGLIGGCIGLMISFVGLQQVTGGRRFTFDATYLLDGIPLVVALVGLFAVGEMVYLLGKNRVIAEEGVKTSGSVLEGARSVVSNFGVFVRSSLVGVIVGLVPAAGGAVSNFIAYAQAAQTVKDSESFGKGDIRGVIASESANDSKDGGAAIPTLSFGIPGSTVWALILGALLIHGINPGPQLMNQHLDVVFIILFSLVFSNILASIFGLAVANQITLVTRIPPTILAPFVFILALIGVYTLRFQIPDVFVAVVFGTLALVFIIYNISRIAVVIGLVLGPIVENSFHQSVQMGFGTYEMFYTRPITILIFALLILVLGVSVVRS